MTVQVLLAEDDCLIRTCVADMLDLASMPTCAAASAEAALALIPTLQGPAVLVTDLNFPTGMSGLDLIEAVQRDRPWIGAVLATGANRHGLDLPSGVQFVPKPFAFRQLVQAIAAASAGSQRGALEPDGQEA